MAVSRRSELRRVRRECAALLAELRLPDCEDLPALIRYLSDARGRPLRVVPVSLMASQPCGVWVAATDADWIFYDADTTRAHQEHIILHEIGHMICCHRGSGQLDEDTASAFFPDIDPQLVRDMVARTTYSDEQEQQAEVMAFLLAERLRNPGASTSCGDVAGRIARSLNHSSHPESR
ncbi:hypothetical protein [Haloechinothrix halophila]|uniref:hypothetical protein n=1 Tax=Haloechinothrix halophila TaxID=1069073 RepID=UPI00040E2255|nr:hypothetical protein [Haloechinothrix halophila]